MKFKFIRRLLAISIMLCVLFFNTFNSKAYYSSKPLLVEISTQWCFACKMLKPTIEELARQYNGRVEFILLDATNDETIEQAKRIAENYGIRDYFDSHRNAFPTVGVFSNSGSLEKFILGANGKEAYVQVLDSLLGGSTIATNSEPVRPQEPQFPEITGKRPDEPNFIDRPVEPNFLDRPAEPVLAGRPPELSFWNIGQTIPAYAYNSYIILPKCSSNNNIICNASFSGVTNGNNNGTNIKVFNPSTGTRDVKGLHF